MISYEEWLDPANKEPAKIEELLKTHFVKDLKSYPISKLVNRVENNSKECMEPVGNIGQSESLENYPKKG